MGVLRLLLMGAFFAVSCGGSAPSAPTDLRSGFSATPSEASAPIADSESAVDIDRPHVSASATTKTFTLSGTVTDKAYSSWKISGAVVTVTPGSVKATTSSAGKYAVKLRAGVYTIKIARSGYGTATIKTRVSGNATLNASLAPTKPSGATARCKDRTWSKSQNRSGTCSHHKGVAYWVCPGKLCK